MKKKISFSFAVEGTIVILNITFGNTFSRQLNIDYYLDKNIAFYIKKIKSLSNEDLDSIYSLTISPKNEITFRVEDAYLDYFMKSKNNKIKALKEFFSQANASYKKENYYNRHYFKVSVSSNENALNEYERIYQFLKENDIFDTLDTTFIVEVPSVKKDNTYIELEFVLRNCFSVSILEKVLKILSHLLTFLGISSCIIHIKTLQKAYLYEKIIIAGERVKDIAAELKFSVVYEKVLF